MLFVQVLGLVFLLFLSGFFSAAETALFSLNRMERRRLEDVKPKAAKRLFPHLENPRRTLITILIGNLIVNILATSLVTLMVLQRWGGQGVGLSIFVFTLVLILTGEIVPKILAVRFNVPIALAVARPLWFFSVLIFPLRWVTREISSAILKYFLPVHLEHPDHLSEEELKTLVKIGEEEGVLDSQERQMIQKTMMLGERPAKDIMIPRTDMAALDASDSRENQEEQIRKFHFSHFPVYQDSIDNITGILPVQEMMLHPEKPIATLLKEPFFIPEMKRIDDLFVEFRKRDERLAICVDEYGGTAGIVTMEDIVEEIFGEFYDEYARVEHPIRRLGEGDYYIEAKIPLAELNEYFGIDLKAAEASTLGGYILEKLGEVPKPGQRLSDSGISLEIHDVLRKRQIRSVILRITP